MSILTVLFDVLAPVVLVVATGAIVGHRINVDLRSLSRLAYWVLGPAFMFDVLAGAELDASVVLQLCLAGLVGMAAAGLAAAAILRISGCGGSIIAAETLTASYGNVGNAGLAISAFAFGPELLPAAGVFMLAINTTGMMLGVGLAHGRDGSIIDALRQALVAPMTIASVLGLLANSFSVNVPVAFDRSISLVAGALIPTMLFTLGMQLRLTGRVRIEAPSIVSAACKLLVAPAAATAAAIFVGLDGDLVGVTAVQSAMPPAVFCMVIALEHDLEPQRVTATLVLATVLSLLTLPFVLLLTT